MGPDTRQATVSIGEKFLAADVREAAIHDITTEDQSLFSHNHRSEQTNIDEDG
jgi:hypothetical protein